MVTMALAVKRLEAEEKDEMARILHGTVRDKIKVGKPQFPTLDWTGEVITRPRMALLITTDSWLIFDILGLTESQVL
jgi:hypothetical protein